VGDKKLTTLHLDDDGIRALVNVTDAADALVVMYEGDSDPDTQLDEDTWAMYALLNIDRDERRVERLRKGAELG